MKIISRRTGLAGATIGWRVPVVTVALLLFIVAMTAVTQTASAADGPTVSSDKQEYSPGDTVTITGSGFDAGANLTVHVTDPVGATTSTAVTADGSGGFVTTYQIGGLPDANGEFTIDVLDADGGLLATAVFYDSHFRYGHMTWEQISGNTVEFKFTVGMRNYGPFTAGQNAGQIVGRVNFGDGSSVSPSFTAIFASGPNTQTDWFLAETTFQHTYAGPGPYTAFNANCCRQIPLQHVNNPNGGWRVETIVDMNNGNTGSPVSSLPAIVDCPQSAVCNFPIPVLDPDGDPVQYRMSVPAEWAVPNQPGPPHAPNAASINAATGVYSWDTTGATLKAGETLYSTQIMIEELVGGNVQGKVALDFMIRLIAGNPPVIDVPPSPPANTNFPTTPGNAVTFPIQGSDTDVGDTVTIQAIGLPAGSTFVCGGANPVSCTFNWVPTNISVGQYVLTFIAKDQLGFSSAPHPVTITVGQESVPPTCLVGANTLTVQDTGSGLSSIFVTNATNASVLVPAFPVGTPLPVVVTATHLNTLLPGSVDILTTDAAGNQTACGLQFQGSGAQSCSSQITYLPDGSTFTSSGAAVPNGPAGTFGFDAVITNTGGNALTGITSELAILTNGNLLLSADNGAGAVGDTYTLPLVGDYADGILSPGESAAIPHLIGLAVFSQFDFFMDVDCTVAPIAP